MYPAPTKEQDYTKINIKQNSVNNQEYVLTPKQSITHIETNVRNRPSIRSNSKIKCIVEIKNSFKITDTTPTARNKNVADIEHRVL